MATCNEYYDKQLVYEEVKTDSHNTAWFL